MSSLINFLLGFCPIIILAISGHVNCVGRIINGHVSEYVPHAARVTGFSVEYGTEGSGTFVTLSHVVTAGSVIHDMSIMYVYYGNESMGAAKSLGGLGFTHPDYNPTTFENDIGIVVLGTATAASVVTPIALPVARDTPIVGDIGLASGFGLRLDASRGWVLNFDKQTGQFRVIDEGSCRSALGVQQEAIATSHFCTENAASLCFGDIGNGLTLDMDGVETLVGVVSVITNMCHVTYPVMYTQVSLYTEWIQESISGK